MMRPPSAPPSDPSGSVVDIDWDERWRALVEEREAQAARLRALAGLAAPAYWDRRAEGFRANVHPHTGEPDRLLQLVYSITGIVGLQFRTHAAKYCFMAIRTVQRDAQLLDVWKRVHGEDKCREPGFAELYNLRLQRLEPSHLMLRGSLRVG